MAEARLHQNGESDSPVASTVTRIEARCARTRRAWRTLLKPALIAPALLVCVPPALRGQDAVVAPANCDSVVMAARVDSISTAFYVTASRTDLGFLSTEQAHAIAMAVATMFTPPRPLRLAVFSGAPQMRTLRRMAAEASTVLRAPTVTGVYRIWSKPKADSLKPLVVRSSLTQGFDAAAGEAIVQASTSRETFAPPAGDDSMLVEVRFSNDSSANAVRLVEANFPRMPIVDAAPRLDNPTPVFPESEKQAGVAHGDAVLRFVVDRTGAAALEAVEIVRASSIAFAREALAVLPQQRFTPATIKGCAVAQVLTLAFTFDVPEDAKVQPRH